MTSNQDETRRRSATRAPIGRTIKLQFDDSMDLIEGHCRNVSIGGMYIVFDHARPPGSLVRFELDLGDNNAIRGLGEVVWMRPKRDHSGPEAGFGLKFRFLEQRDRQLIFKLVSQHIKERLSKREPANGSPDGASLDAVSEDSSGALSPPPPSAQPVLTEAAPELLPPLENFSDTAGTRPETLAPIAGTAIGASSAPTSVPEVKATSNPAADEDDWLKASKAPTEVPTAEGVDLDPSVGETPIYELGLEHSRQSSDRPSFFQDPAPSSPASLGELSTESKQEAAVEDSNASGSYESMGESDLQRDIPTVSPQQPTKREFAILPVVVVLLIAGAAGFYLFKDEILARIENEATTQVSPTEPGETEKSPTPEGQVSEVVREAHDEPITAQLPQPQQVTSHEPIPEVGQRTSQVPPASPPVASSPAVAPPPPLSSQQLPSETTPSTTTKPDPSPAATRSTTAPETAFSRLLDVSWSEIPDGGLKVTLIADGPIPTGRYSYFRLPGTTPREVIKLLEVRHGFATSRFKVDVQGIDQIRVGYHPKPREIHIVIDLSQARWKIVEVRNLGHQLEVHLAQE